MKLLLLAGGMLKSEVMSVLQELYLYQSLHPSDVRQCVVDGHARDLSGI